MNGLAPHTLPAVRFEHSPVAVFAQGSVACRAVAAEIAALIRERDAAGRSTVLGLATGSTPVRVYAELVRLHREEGLSFARVVTFNLDEYHPLPPEHPESYHAFMRRHLFDHVDIPPAQANIPSGTVAPAQMEDFCRDYERRIQDCGGIDIQILGIGRTGHIGFNEPGSPRRSVTRLVSLDPLTRRDASGDFGGEAHTPRAAITMGVRTILAARRVILMAWGQHKADIVRRAVEEEPTSSVTASYLQEHDNALYVLDAAAAGELTRFRTPWLVGPLDEQGLAWDEPTTRRALLWLARRTKKPLLKLTDDDYNEAGLQDLLRVHGSAYEANLAGFYQLQHTITGWPGGRDPARTRPGDALVRPLRARSAGVFPKRVLVLSPHPDDDVISMGGTLCRLADHGHEVHVAYQVSGYGAVPDEALAGSLMFLRDSTAAGPEGTAEAARLCETFEQTGALPQNDATRRWKALIRRHEAIAAARLCGVPTTRLHFLDLPFYESGSSRERRFTAADVERTLALLRQVQPHLVFAAGDLDDPHGTHRMCLRILRDALVAGAGDAWLADAELWLYRGAWAEWPLDEIDMAVPLSPQEVLRRRSAIFRHVTQKDQVLFPGGDRREFWQRTEDRGRRLAAEYDTLGLAEYEAIEAFKRFTPQAFATATGL
ncbi:glucosamine-6-phosphate deaminase [Opitutales bacterium ASA1]|uniref:glucosamine-6-phosphate deaminase n=1 Tax=Congregicoccus parvus TaxID=3081749 RepID=UPI002B2B1C36|nr:glucosamine-6-phosphate deaminase [Opitutales bacterium ASA1]